MAADHLHVTPVQDSVDHDTSGIEPDCICGPYLQPVKYDDGGVAWLIVHHSLDGREQRV